MQAWFFFKSTQFYRTPETVNLDMTIESPWTIEANVLFKAEYVKNKSLSIFDRAELEKFMQSESDKTKWHWALC